MAQKKRRRLRPAVRGTLYALCLCITAALLYGTVFVWAYPGTQTESDSSVSASVQNSENRQQSSESASDSSAAETEPAPVWPEGTDYGYPLPAAPGTVSKTILLDPGHGGSDGGHIAADGTLEKNLTLDLCRRIKAHLEAQNPALNVVLLREDDNIDEWSTSSWADLSYRMKMQETLSADYVLSIHVGSFDDPAQSGYQFYLNADDPMTCTLAADIAANLHQAGFSRDLGTVTMEDYPLQTVLMSNAHSMQIELGALSNEQDLAMLKDEQSAEQICAGIASALSCLIDRYPDAPAYQSRQKDVAQQLEAEKQRRASEERRRQEEEEKKRQEEEKKKQEEERQNATKASAA